MSFNIKYNDNGIKKYNMMIKNGKQLENIWRVAEWTTPERMNKNAFCHRKRKSEWIMENGKGSVTRKRKVGKW